ncbi:MAG: hypothetical protein HC849_00955 [Oscillatoriales cyanobacterium RU_3_3]|nr:hypothetical protein [Microcoleus sp. SU_5_3]NJL66110.1 hypothetical protein [Microcoleus sp. SM1_3_4]NJM59078.1 hypothetical protein [Oscillatoriales cyanobacterium RU_3_3]
MVNIERKFWSYGHPIVVKKEVVEEIFKASLAICDWFKKQINTPEKLSQWVDKRTPYLLGKSLSSYQVNKQLFNYINQGFNIPFEFDVLLSIDSQGSPKFTCVEFQSAIGYLGWIKGLTDICVLADNSLTKYQSSYHNPINDLIEIKIELAKNQEIIVMDINPLTSRTSVDLIEMAKILGDEKSLPVSPLDVYREDGKWYINVRNKNNQHIRTIQANYVLCRMTKSDIISLEKQIAGDVKKRNLLLDFFRDGSIQWIWHPAWQNILDKRDLQVLQEINCCQKYASLIYQENQVVTSDGVYVKKPMDETGGYNQEVIQISASRNYIVPNGYIFQEFIKVYPLQVDIKALNLSTLATLELRVMPTIAWNKSNKQRGSYLMARLAPRREKIAGKITKTNILPIQDSVDRWITWYKNKTGTTVPATDMPFGMCPVFIET